jgi:hypothetical protein
VGGQTTDHISLADRIVRLKRLDDEIVRKAADFFESGTKITSSDLFVFGACKRTLTQSQGFRELIVAKNFPCAAAILRCQIDTAMRVNALAFVGDPDAFCRSLQEGARFNKLKDKSGAKLTDAHLRKRLAEKHPWVEVVYEHTSDFVHLSGQHLASSIYQTEGEARIVRFAITSEDPPRAEDAYYEIVDTFFDATKLVGTLLLAFLTARRPIAFG